MYRRLPESICIYQFSSTTMFSPILVRNLKSNVQISLLSSIKYSFSPPSSSSPSIYILVYFFPLCSMTLSSPPPARSPIISDCPFASICFRIPDWSALLINNARTAWNPCLLYVSMMWYFQIGSNSRASSPKLSRNCSSVLYRFKNS